MAFYPPMVARDVAAHERAARRAGGDARRSPRWRGHGAVPGARPFAAAGAAVGLRVSGARRRAARPRCPSAGGGPACMRGARRGARASSPAARRSSACWRSSARGVPGRAGATGRSCRSPTEATTTLFVGTYLPGHGTIFGLKHALAREALQRAPFDPPQIRLPSAREGVPRRGGGTPSPPHARRRDLRRAAPQPARLPARPARRLCANDGQQSVADVGLPVPRRASAARLRRRSGYTAGSSSSRLRASRWPRATALADPGPRPC